ncbi:helix-turn-helix domain-containing protein [Trichloromonas sp.]|uniref:helix-turn-helix domain-containing protein n=1 Tax=Trichloromonas sp. TaxID=3069249 RepID=UPI002A3F9ED2|nr:helix-turn-helix domain-containing protein [Trichloromonas sp.]
MTDSERLSVGSRLRLRREELGLSLADLADKTRVRLSFLQSLEEDRFDAFPGEAYLFGFLKSYAEALGLSPEALTEELRAQIGKGSGFSEIPPLVNDPFLIQSSRPRLWLRRSTLSALAVLALAGIAFFAWRYGPWTPPYAEFRQPSPVEEVVPPVPIPEEPAALPTESSETAAPVEEPPAAAVGTSPESLPAAGGVLRVETREQVALEIRIDEQPPRQYTLAGGSSISWSAAKSLRLRVDRPDALALWLDEQPLDLRGRSELLLRGDVGEPEE